MVLPTSNFSQTNREILSVADLNRQARRLLEGKFGMIFVEGEISNLAKPSSGHWYFTLKDQHAQVRCAMFKNRNQRLRFQPEDGMQVIVRGRISLYEGRGEFQLIGEYLEESGDGALRREFEKLKQSLSREGLFDIESKKPLPGLPQHVAVITSRSGAAISDVLTVLARRFPAIPVSVLPVQVQGEAAVGQICRAIELVNAALDEVDVIILTRGGGSLEDLHPFNTEALARAIYASRVPIISAVGHEIDVTIADFVADARAATPSAAAEIISPNWQDLLQTFLGLEAKLEQLFKIKIAQAHSQIDNINKRIRHPGQRLADHARRLDDLEIRLRNTTHNNLRKMTDMVELLSSRLPDPRQRVQLQLQHLGHLAARFQTAIETGFTNAANRLSSSIQQLNALSPLSTLARGYAIVTPESSPLTIVTEAEQLSSRDKIQIRLAKGEIAATVDKVDPESHDPT